VTRPTDPANNKATGPTDATQTGAYGRAAVSSLGNYKRPIVSRWRPGVAGTTRDGLRFVYFGDHIRIGGSTAWRTNNPGSIFINVLARQNGAIGRDRHQAIFPTWDTGRAALMSVIHSSAYRKLTAQAVLSEFFKSEENSSGTGDHALDLSTSLDQMSDAQLHSLVERKTQKQPHEVGTYYIRGSKARWVVRPLRFHWATPPVGKSTHGMCVEVMDSRLRIYRTKASSRMASTRSIWGTTHFRSQASAGMATTPFLSCCSRRFQGNRAETPTTTRKTHMYRTGER
jgi:hypothetical protein